MKSHTARRTVATLLDDQGMTARRIADQLGHARPSMTQDVYMGRRVIDTVACSLDGLIRDRSVQPSETGRNGEEGGVDEASENERKAQ